jgi:hypothetical protein
MAARLATDSARDRERLHHALSDRTFDVLPDVDRQSLRAGRDGARG